MESAAVQVSHGLSHHTNARVAWGIHFRGPGLKEAFGMGTGPSPQLWPLTPKACSEKRIIKDFGGGGAEGTFMVYATLNPRHPPFPSTGFIRAPEALHPIWSANP